MGPGKNIVAGSVFGYIRKLRKNRCVQSDSAIEFHHSGELNRSYFNGDEIEKVTALQAVIN